MLRLLPIVLEHCAQKAAKEYLGKNPVGAAYSAQRVTATSYAWGMQIMYKPLSER
jgi:hypothetical protein